MSGIAVENIPLELRQHAQWVCWRYEDHGGKPTKVPYCVRTGSKASSTNPETWCTFDEAVAAKGFDGIGFVFTPNDPFCGVDLDECITKFGITPEARAVLASLATYAEISPSGTGVKLILRGTKPTNALCQKKNTHGCSRVEVYDQARFFTITGQVYNGSPRTVNDAQAALDALCCELWPPKPLPPPPRLPRARDDQERRCMAYLRKCPESIEGQDGSGAMLRAAGECARFDLDDAASWRVMQWFNREKCSPPWSDKEIAHKLEDAREKVEREGAVGIHLRTPPAAPTSTSTLLDAADLCAANLELHEPVIHGLLRRGEVGNLISAPKMQKSYALLDLAISLVTGETWLGFQCLKGRVLLLDFELHAPTLTHRLKAILRARGLESELLRGRLTLECFRGKRMDVNHLADYVAMIQPGTYDLVIVDPLYKIFPTDLDENSNSAMAGVYSQLQAYTESLNAAMVVCHHASKGSQSDKSVTDVGAGAGSQSRAADAHLSLRPHAEERCAVMAGVVRSWPPFEAKPLRWIYPLWVPAPELDPTDLLAPNRKKKSSVPELPAEPSEPVWTPELFTEKFVTDAPRAASKIVTEATAAGIPERRAKILLNQSEGMNLIHRWIIPEDKRLHCYANKPQSKLAL